MADRLLRVCEVRYGEFHMHYRGIRRSVWRDTHRGAGSGNQAKARACADDGARALPSAPPQTGAPGQEADRTPDLPEPPVDVEARPGAGVAATLSGEDARDIGYGGLDLDEERFLQRLDAMGNLRRMAAHIA